MARYANNPTVDVGVVQKGAGLSSDLARRRQVRTRAEIVDAAIALFLEQGFDATTMDDIAEAAGVSRRTAYRYFENKDELVFEEPRQWLEHFNQVLGDRQPGESSRDILRRALVSVARQIQQTSERVLAAYSVLISSPSLDGRHAKTDQLWRDLCAAVIAPDLEGQSDALAQTVVTVSALIGVTNGVIAVWAMSQPGADLPQLTIDGLDQIDSVWPQATR